MNTPKHTPGPWRRMHDHPDESCRESIAFIRGPINKDYPESDRYIPEIATVFGCEGSCISEQQSANADLIAAAPELYRVLRDCVEIMECVQRGGQPRTPHALWMATAKAVLAKAAGKGELRLPDWEAHL